MCITRDTSNINEGKLSNKSYEASGGIHGEPHETSRGPLEASWGVPGNLIGLSWGPHGDLLKTLKASWGLLEASWRSHEASWGAHGNFIRVSWGPHEGSWGPHEAS